MESAREVLRNGVGEGWKCGLEGEGGGGESLRRFRGGMSRSCEEESACGE